MGVKLMRRLASGDPSEAGDKFEHGIFWELYKDLERQFEGFLEYVPYLDGNENVYSFKLVNLILSIGGHVDSAFKEMARYPKFSNNKDCEKIRGILKKSEENIRNGKAPKTVPIWLPLRAFEKEYKLSMRKVTFKRLPEREDVIPFKPENPETRAPKWWRLYNGLKHDVSINIMEANLQNTLHALASAFLLNVIHRPAVLRLFDYDVLKFYDSFISSDCLLLKPAEVSRDVLQGMIEKKMSFPGSVETSLFIYDYAQ